MQQEQGSTRRRLCAASEISRADRMSRQSDARRISERRDRVCTGEWECGMRLRLRNREFANRIRAGDACRVRDCTSLDIRVFRRIVLRIASSVVGRVVRGEVGRIAR